VLVPAQWNAKHFTSTVAKHIDTMRHVPYFFLLQPSHCVIQYKYQLKDYSIQSEHNK